MEAAAQSDDYVTYSEEYRVWLDRAGDLHEYLLRMPASVLEPAGMDGRHQQLLDRWEGLAPFDDDVGEDELTQLRAWIHDSETLINYIVYERQPPGSTKKAVKKRARPQPIEALEEADGVQEDWHWPWIEGWDNPAKRDRILNPPKDKKTLKKVLIVGGIATAAVIIGRRVFE
jgi:hypothetical protein